MASITLSTRNKNLNQHLDCCSSLCPQSLILPIHTAYYARLPFIECVFQCHSCGPGALKGANLLYLLAYLRAFSYIDLPIPEAGLPFKYGKHFVIHFVNVIQQVWKAAPSLCIFVKFLDWG